MTEAEFLQSLERQVQAKQITPEDARSKWFAWLLQNKSDGTDPKAYASFIDGANAMPNPADLLAAGPTPFVGPAKSASTTDLENTLNVDQNMYGTNEVNVAKEELDRRAKIEGMSFFDALTSPDALARIGKAALKGPAQTVNGIVNGVPALIDTFTGNDQQAADKITDLVKLNSKINERFGSSDAITPLESAGEAASSAFVPGGPLIKAGSMATDFMVDQTVRELTDDKTSDYNTIFDNLNISGADEAPTFGMKGSAATAMGGAALGAFFLNPRMLGVLKTTSAMAPFIREINSIDRLAPSGLKTIETSADALKMQTVDAQTALSDILRRAGVPNPDELDKQISLNSGSAARTRVHSAMRSGQFSLNGINYNVPVPVQRIIDGANGLEATVRQAISHYINLMDMIDDAKIAQAANVAGNHAVNIAQKTAEAARIAATHPQVVFFKQAYEQAMAGIRTMFEGNMLDSKKVQWLSANRPNYVPIDISPVDKDAGLFTRLRQAQRAGEMSPEDWFLQKRESIGDYDPTIRADPFVVLQSYTEHALNLVMKNETRRAIVDGLMNSSYGKDTIRAVDNAKDNVEANLHRIIEFYKDGEKQRFFTSGLVAGIAKFDPYVAKYPILYGVKRGLEKTTTGAITFATGAFAPTSFMRDAIAALVFKPQQLWTGAGPLSVAMAIPKQFWITAKRDFAARLQAGIDSGNSIIPDSLWDVNGRQAFVDKISNQYTNSLYHTLNEQGGFDASINKANLDYARSAMGELKRSISEADFWKNPAFTNVVMRFGIDGAKVIMDGIVDLHNAIMDSSRYATAEKLVKKGVPVDDAARAAKKISGDTSRTGRTYDAEGKAILPDAVDQGPLNAGMKTIGGITEFIRESTPYYNPTVQGFRTLINGFQTDPIGTMFRAHMYVGLPATIALAWNEMLGKEYNDYAMSQRSADDVAKSIYVAIPGLPPEQGMEWSIPQELMLMNAPYSRGLYGFMRDDETGEYGDALQVLMQSIFRNSGDMSIPPLVKGGLNYFGMESYDGIANSFNSAAQIREDNVGVLPQNVENMARSLFANLGGLAIETAYIFSNPDPDAAPFSDFADNVYEQFMSGTNIVKQVSGRKISNVKFSIPAQIAYEKKAAIQNLDPLFKRFFDPEYKNEDGLDQPSKSKYEKLDKLPESVAGETRPDLPFVYPGPNNQEQPTNPLIPIFGGLLLKEALNSGLDMSALDDRLSKYDKYVKLLKSYNSGDRASLKEFQSFLEDATLQDKESKKLKTLLEDFDIDLTEYSDRVKLINIIENEETFIYRQKLEIYDIVEKKVETTLKDNGLLPSDKTFKIENDLDPYNNSPMGIPAEAFKTLLEQAAE